MFIANSSVKIMGDMDEALSEDVRANISRWLFFMCAMVFTMVMIGGLTRLTHSGLSMVVWRPVTGWLPPLNLQEWQETFGLYRETPEYLLLNFGMTLSEFKSIYWLEYIHRLWGRLIGLAFALPFGYFLIRRQLNKSLIIKLLFVFFLGASQGFLGWYMVKSGLVEKPDVSQYRLTLHLGMTILIYISLFWLALHIRKPLQLVNPINWRPIPVMGLMVITFICLTMIAGSLVAGLKAGFTYNTFPLMDGKIVPDGLWILSPFYLNFFENITMVQFQHRLLGCGSVILVTMLSFNFYRNSNSYYSRKATAILAICILLQFLTGAVTLIYVVPIFLASFHQLMAFICLSVSIWILFSARGQN